MTNASLLSDFLTELGVKHTRLYSDSQMATMPFKSLFGLSKLLESYGVESEGWHLDDKRQLLSLTPPFLADTPDGFVIVTAISPDSVTYMTDSVSETMPFDGFSAAITGDILLAFPKPDAIEPGYNLHRDKELISVGKKWALILGVVALAAYLIVVGDIWRHASMWAVIVVDLIGLTLSYMLVQKSLSIHNKAADKVCGVLQEGGCDSVLSTKASSFFGIFSWSEVGLTYFGVSLLALLVFPQSVGYLALCNICCLPFTVWSIWYQRFRAKAWCTLCVSVQTSLWLLFFAYLWGGWVKLAFPLGIGLAVLVVTYGVILLSINRLMPLMSNKPKVYDNGTETDTASQA